MGDHFVVKSANMANSANHPLGVGKWVVIHVIRYMDCGVKAYSVVDWGVECLLAAYGPNSPLARAMGSR